MRRWFLYGAIFFSAVVVIFSAVAFFAYPLKYKSHITAACAEFNLDKPLLAAIINAESHFQPDAVSPKGAVGLMQIMPATARQIAGELNLTDYDLTDPATNIRMGAFYLRYLFDKFADRKTALAAYNAGEGRVTEWLGTAKALKTTPYPETNDYIARILNGRKYYRLRLM